MVPAELCYALRLMRRNPGFSAVAVLSLALGIGANTAIFSLLNTVMLRSLPVPHPEQLVEFLQKYPTEARGNGSWTHTDFEHFRANNHVFSDIAGTSFDDQARVRFEGEPPATAVGEAVTGNYFRMLGLKPAIGRLIDSGDRGVAVVSWSYWTGRLQRDAGIVGRRLLVEDAPLTIVGVAPREFEGPRTGMPTEIWISRDPSKDGLTLFGRLKPGAVLAEARAEMAVLYRFTRESRPRFGIDPQVARMSVEVEPAAAGLSNVRDRIGKPLLMLMAVVGSLLLLACTNLAGMLLARGAARQKELAVRVAIGASRPVLVRQTLTESLLLSLIGGLFGAVLAYFGIGLLLRIMESARPLERVEIQVRPDWHVLVFMAAIAVLTGLLFGMAPAWHAFRSAPAAGLRHGGAAGDSRVRRWFGKGLVSAQVALSILLVSAAAIFLAHLSRLRNENLGFRSDHVLLMILDPPAGYNRDELAGHYRELLSRLQAIPGVQSASLCACSPIQGCGASRFVTVEGFQERPEDRGYVALSWVAPDYFQAIGTPLLAGRDFRFQEDRHAAIISQDMARRYFPRANPIGRHITIDADRRTGGWSGDPTYEVIGVVGDSKMTELRDPPHRAMYFNMFQQGRIYSQFVLRTRVSPSSVAGSARRAARDAIKNAAIGKITTLSDQVDSAIVPERLIAMLSEFFGGLGALLAGIGLYGLLAYSVARRIHEIGVRMALGATAGDVRGLVLRDTAGMVAAGIVLGSALVVWLRPLAASVVQDVRADNVAPALTAGLVVMAIALLASYLPARRAAHVDPIQALRHE